MSVNQGDKIGALECPDCGADVDMKISKNMTVYAICTNVVDVIETENKYRPKLERCGRRQFYGRRKSEQLIKEFLGENIQNDRTHQDQVDQGHRAKPEYGAEYTAPARTEQPSGEPKTANADAGLALLF